MEDYNWLKLFFIFFCFFEAFLMGMLPVKVTKCRESLAILGIANAFSGGVFIAIALMHIMPESTEGWEKYMCEKFLDADPDKTKTKLDCPDAYPLPYLLLVLGYGIILILDKVIFDSHSMFHDEHGHGGAKTSMTKATLALRDQMEQIANDPENKDIKAAVATQQIQLENEIKKDLVQNYKQAERQAAIIRRQSTKTKKKTKRQQSIQENSPTSTRSGGTALKESAHTLSDMEAQSNHFVNPNQVDHEGLASGGQRDSLLKKHDEHNDGEVRQPSCTENMTPFVLLIGLGAHSLFEGLAVGMANDLEKVFLFVMAIGMHKGAAGMSLGINFTRAFPDRDNLVLWLLLAFAMFTPVGIALGWALESDNDLLEIIFSCLAAGTFLYIACSEVIVEEFSMPDYKWPKFLFFVIGIAVISSLKFLDPD